MNQACRPTRCMAKTHVESPSPDVGTVADTQRSRVTGKEDKARETDSVNGAQRAESKHRKQVEKNSLGRRELCSVFPGKGRLHLGCSGKLK